jgi:hypothetical protein
MKRILAVSFLMGAVAAGAAAEQPSSATRRASSTHRVHKLQPSAAPAPAGAPQPTVASSSAVFPAPSAAVSYENGLLSIAAENASLQQIMEKVRASTGAAVEAPPFAERITVVLGPQPPAAVLSALLEGSHLNYIIVGDSTDAHVIRAIQITPEPAARAASASPSQNQDAEAAAARARAIFLAQTGGDEGVWENASEPQSSPVGVPAPPGAGPSSPNLSPGTE